jgi:hypothetical protein
VIAQPKPRVPSVPKPTLITAKIVGKAGDPLVWAAADIDYVGTFTIVKLPLGGPLTVSFDGKLDQFPAYEAYARFNGTTKELFTSSPPAGNTVADLVGFATRPIKASVLFTQ